VDAILIDSGDGALYSGSLEFWGFIYRLVFRKSTPFENLYLSPSSIERAGSHAVVDISAF
jgi:hypothetical protein